MASSTHTRLRDVLGEYVVAASHEPLQLGEHPIQFSDEAAALRFLMGVAGGGDGRQAIGRLYDELGLGTARALSDEEVTRAIAARVGAGVVRIAAVGMPSVTVAGQQGVVGMNQVHVERMQHFCARRRIYVIVRAGNAIGLRFHGQKGFISKPKDVKAFKTAKKGPFSGLVALDSKERVVGSDGAPKPTSLDDGQWQRIRHAWSAWKTSRPDERKKRFDEFEASRPRQWGHKEWVLWQNEWENWLELRGKGWSFDSDGVLRDPDGRAVHGDYDLQGAYRDLDDGRFEQIFAEEDLVVDLNAEVAPENPMFQHGANDEGGNFMDTEAITLIGSDGRSIAGSRAIMWREAEPDESFLAFHPTGALTVLTGFEELQPFYAARGWVWLYNNPNTGG